MEQEEQEIKRGDKVKITDIKDIYPSWKEEGNLKHGQILTVRHVKQSGGLLFEECCLGYNMFGQERGLMPKRVTLIKKYKTKS